MERFGHMSFICDMVLLWCWFSITLLNGSVFLRTWTSTVCEEGCVWFRNRYGFSLRTVLDLMSSSMESLRPEKRFFYGEGENWVAFLYRSVSFAGRTLFAKIYCYDWAFVFRNFYTRDWKEFLRLNSWSIAWSIFFRSVEETFCKVFLILDCALSVS